MNPGERRPVPNSAPGFDGFEPGSRLVANISDGSGGFFAGGKLTATEIGSVETRGVTRALGTMPVRGTPLDGRSLDSVLTAISGSPRTLPEDATRWIVRTGGTGKAFVPRGTTVVVPPAGLELPERIGQALEAGRWGRLRPIPR